MKTPGFAVAGLLVALVAAPVGAEQATPPATVSDAPATLNLSSLSRSTPAPERVAPASELESAPLDRSAAALDRPAGDGRRTLSSFPLNVARGVVGVFARDSLLPLALGSGIALTGHTLDRRFEATLQGRCFSCGRTGASVGGAGVVPAVGALFLVGRFAPQGAFRAASYDFAQALAVNGVWTGALKMSLRRQRPDASDRLSLPSGHTSMAFSLATVTDRHFGWKAGVPAYLLATGIGLSRIESDKHFLSDVLAGATIGVIVGRRSPA